MQMENKISGIIVYYLPGRIMRVIMRRATMLAGYEAEARSVLRAF